jgi:hypothetical protein
LESGRQHIWKEVVSIFGKRPSAYLEVGRQSHKRVFAATAILKQGRQIWRIHFGESAQLSDGTAFLESVGIEPLALHRPPFQAS